MRQRSYVLVMCPICSDVLLGIVCANVFISARTTCYYIARNKVRDRKWNAMTEREKINYLETTQDEGNKTLDFRIAH